MPDGTLTVREVFRRVTIDLQDTPQFQRYPEQDLVDYFNDACLALASFVPSLCTRVDILLLQDGSRQSIGIIPPALIFQGPAETIIGMALIGVRADMGSGAGTPARTRAVRIIDQKTLDSLDPSWVTDFAEEVREYTYDPQTPTYFSIVPPLEAARWAEVAYVAQPRRIPNASPQGAYGTSGSSAELMPVPDEALAFVLPYICARAHMKDSEWSEPAKAAGYSSMALAWMNAQAQRATGKNPNLKRLPFSPVPEGAAA